MAATVEKIQFADDFAAYASTAAKMEAEFIYKEIFTDKSYDVADFPADAFMVDAGGNIGMFSMYMKKKYPASRIIAFEPAPVTFDTFQRNMALHSIEGVEVHQCGLGREESSMTLTYYPQMPGNSTLYVDDKDSQLTGLPQEHPIYPLFQEKKEVQVEIKRLSSFLSQVPDLKRISLLKVDVEGAEIDVLDGIDGKHWDLIDVVVLEVCDSKGDVARAEKILTERGFKITKEKPDWAPENLPMYMLLGKRN